MRIAILVGVASYETLRSIPAASRDVAAMAGLLNAVQQYETVFTLSGTLSAAETKKAILGHLQGVGSTTVDEVFFYYSGHGSLVDGRLIFPMSDFSDAGRRQTSLENDEVDEWLRTLSPRVAIKVLDCCHSGVPYVKNMEDMKAALESSLRKFQSCYFFLSSQEDEPSFAGDDLSCFTKEFVLQVRNRPDGPVRYKDLMDALADSFDNNQQRPQFIVQAPMREIFFDMTESLRRAIADAVPEEAQEETETQAPSSDSLVLIVQRDAAICISKGEAEVILRELRETIAPPSSPQELELLYDLAVQFVNEEDLDSAIAAEEVIGKWLQSKGSGFFARAIVEQPRTPSAVEAAMDPYRSWSRRPYVSGFVTSSGLEYDRIIIRARPKFQNLKSWEMALVLIWSHRQVAVFTYQTTLMARNWDVSDQPEEVRWRLNLFDKTNLERVSPFAGSMVETFLRAVLLDVSTTFAQPLATEGTEASTPTQGA